MRGEKVRKDKRGRNWWGSPPHARGKVTGNTGIGGKDGITPACAGKSNVAGGAVVEYEDHPRRRGEKNRQIRLDM